MKHDTLLMERTRKAFTLIELLVVIAIIAVLAGLTAWGVFAMIGNRQARNTEATIKVLEKGLQTKWAKVISDVKDESPSPVAVALANGPAGNLDTSGQRARVIMKKARLVEAFPMRYSEVQTPTIVNLFIVQRKSYFAKYQTTVAGMTAGGPGESAACLLMALKTLQPNDGALEDQIKFAVTDSDGVNTIPTLVDNWTTPVWFFRFGWNNDELRKTKPASANTRNSKFADPVDPEGQLLTSNWYGSLMTYPANYPIVSFRGFTARQVYENMFHVIVDPIMNPAAAYTVPAIVSSGGTPNLPQVPGLNPDLSIPPGVNATNFIYSFKLRLD